MKIQWFPGHMTKARRMIEENTSQVDAICEIVDARIPGASRNPDVDTLTRRKPRLIVLSRPDLADPNTTRDWLAHFMEERVSALAVNARTGEGLDGFVPAVRALLHERLARLKEKGQPGKTLRLMVLGVPNVGKSSFINKLIGRRSAQVEDRPGVTRGRQWYRIADGLDLLDTPGVLWPRFDDEETGHLLAFTGAVRDDILDVEELACLLLERLALLMPDALAARYGVAAPDHLPSPERGYEMLQSAATRRGFLLGGGRPDTERMARTALDEFRAGKLGRVTLEGPPISTAVAPPDAPEVT